ncbi:DAK2 domain-containing protein, partial [Rhodococcus aerolatus]
GAPGAARAAPARPAAPPAPAGHRPGPVPRFEVTYLLDAAPEPAVAVLRRGLADLGDSVTVAGGGGEHAVHVHCDDVGAALELGLGAGRVHRVEVTLLAEVAPPAARRAVLALAAGPATAELFTTEGAGVARWDQGAADAVTAALLRLGSAGVTLLPNGVASRDTVRDLVHAARARGAVVTVVPTASPLQGLAALAVHDPDREPEDDAVAMAEAAAGMRRGALRVAAERALTWAGECEPGQTLGLAGDEVVVLGDDGPGVLADLLDRLVDGGTELLTALLGPQAGPELRTALAEHVRHAHPGVELVSYPGDAGGDLLLLGVE